MSSFKIALAQYPIDFFENFEGYTRKISGWVSEAAGQGAKLLVFPEYGSMELISLLPENVRSDLKKSVDEMQAFWPKVQELHSQLAQKYDVYILGASFPVERKNTAALYAPNGKTGLQDKCIMTRFEREEWEINSGAGLKFFDTDLGKIGISICYDAEFPLLTRAMVEAGADLILVPSCTDTLAGYNRVKIGAQSRALENQCYVAQSPTVGNAEWSPATDVNIGAAALYGPPDVGFPDDGIIAQGQLNQSGWVYADVNMSKISSVRRHGRVLNHLHWQEQGKPLLPRVETIDLRS